MDFSLISKEICRYLLSPSSTFETYVPFSSADTFGSLDLLNQLSSVTNDYLQEKKQSAPPASFNPKNPNQKTSDQILIQALLKLKHSNSFQKQSLKKSSSIIRKSEQNLS